VTDVWCRDVDIEWERDGSRLQAATRIMFPEHYSRLQIDDLQRSDEATYSCKGCNTECSDKFDIQLYVEGQVLSTVLSLQHKQHLKILVKNYD